MIPSDFLFPDQSTMKKITIIITGTLLTTLGFWFFCPEYGSGYSEEQRELWNERLKIFPAICQPGLNPDQQGPFTLQTNANLFQIFSGQTSDHINEYIRNKIDHDYVLKQQQTNLRDRLAPDCDFAVHPPSSQGGGVPTEGLPLPTLKKLADEGNWEACYYYLLRQESEVDSNREKHFIQMSREEQSLVIYYLALAARTNHAASVFLLRYIQEVNKIMFEKNRQLAPAHKPPGKNLLSEILYPSLDSVAGYEDFRQQLFQGDILSYIMLEYLTPGNIHAPEKEQLCRILLQQEKQGDSRAPGKLARILFAQFQQKSLYAHINEKETRKRLDSLVSRIPLVSKCSLKHQDIVKSYLVKWGIFTPNDCAGWKDYCEASRFAYKSAQQGDLTAMYLWLRFGLNSLDSFTREEWENISVFSRRLLDVGYIPFLELMSQHRSRTTSRLHNVLNSYYSRKSLDALYAKCAAIAPTGCQ